MCTFHSSTGCEETEGHDWLLQVLTEGDDRRVTAGRFTAGRGGRQAGDRGRHGYSGEGETGGNGRHRCSGQSERGEGGKQF